MADAISSPGNIQMKLSLEIVPLRGAAPEKHRHSPRLRQPLLTRETPPPYLEGLGQKGMAQDASSTSTLGCISSLLLASCNPRPCCEAGHQTHTEMSQTHLSLKLLQGLGRECRNSQQRQMFARLPQCSGEPPYLALGRVVRRA